MQKKSKIKIDKHILKKSIRCEKDCACEKDAWESCSKIGESVNEMILYIEKAEDEGKMLSCKYYLPFGGEHYCICPARLYIYKNFGV